MNQVVTKYKHKNINHYLVVCSSYREFNSCFLLFFHRLATQMGYIGINTNVNSKRDSVVEISFLIIVLKYAKEG